MGEESQFKVTAGDLRQYDWQSVLEDSATKDCDAYYSGFIRQLKERQQVGDDLGVRIYRFLAVIASFHPHYDAEGNPYGPMRVDADGTRTMMAEDPHLLLGLVRHRRINDAMRAQRVGRKSFDCFDESDGAIVTTIRRQCRAHHPAQVRRARWCV